MPSVAENHLTTPIQNHCVGLNYYRVKIVDADGQVSYSKIIGLLNRQTGFEVVGIAPTRPFSTRKAS